MLAIAFAYQDGYVVVVTSKVVSKAAGRLLPAGEDREASRLASGSATSLAGEVMAWAGRIAAGEARLLALIGELDRREAWAGPGLLSCAHWLSWRLGLAMGAARERVRVARALDALPLTGAAFSAGQLSWTKVRTITRVASPDDEAVLVDLARHTTGVQLERVVRGMRRARRPAEDAADRQEAAWRMRPRLAYDEDGTLVLTLRLPAEKGAVVLAALEGLQTQIDTERQTTHATHAARSACDADVPAGTPEPDGPAFTPDPDRPWFEGPGPPPAILNDALVRLDEQAGTARRGRPARLQVLIDPLSGWGRLQDGELLPPGSLEAVRDQLPRRLRPLTAADLTAHDAGRADRLPSALLRQFLGAVDGERCRFPGCPRSRSLHAHHVRFWRDGGRTDLANLALVCSRHHTLIHTERYQLVLHPDRRLTVTTAAGVPVPHRPALPWRSAQELDPERRIGAHTLPTRWDGSPMDLGHVAWVLTQHAA